jgi:hypothetical protein
MEFTPLPKGYRSGKLLLAGTIARKEKARKAFEASEASNVAFTQNITEMRSELGRSRGIKNNEARKDGGKGLW